jgi:cytoskeletal protein RodZ
MNRRKKLLCVLLLALFLFCYTSINVFAEEKKTDPPATSQNTGSQADSKAQSSHAASETPVSSAKPAEPKASSAPSHAASPVPSRSPASSRRVQQAVAPAASSEAESAVSSEVVSSGAESGLISLPGVDSLNENDPLASASNGSSSNRMNRIGILAWICIGLGVLVVLIVILSNHRPPRGPGRKRYRRPKRGGGKRLLSDKYYRGLNRY